MTTTFEKAKGILGRLSDKQHKNACRYVPKNGNIYVYGPASNATDYCVFADFYGLVRILGDETKLIECELWAVDEDTATFRFECGGPHKISVDKTKIVIVD